VSKAASGEQVVGARHADGVRAAVRGCGTLGGVMRTATITQVIIIGRRVGTA
jgi:hypothetical protein